MKLIDLTTYRAPSRASSSISVIILVVGLVSGLGLFGCGRAMNGSVGQGQVAGGLPGPILGGSRPVPPVFESPPESPPESESESESESEQKPNRPHVPDDSENEPATGAVYSPLQRVTPSKAFLSFYSTSGQPRLGSSKSFQQRLQQRFSERLNQAAPYSEKGERVFGEIVRAVNREVASSRALMIISSEKARQASIETERNGGRSPKAGAWSIAVRQTAVRHGFANVPCAEFVSEVVREAYARAGLDVVEDFNQSRKNQLIWHSTAAVQGLGRALYKAGWIPWTSFEYRPPIGAIMLNGVGDSPGHAYFAAGSNGRLIVDNGAPQGRDLGSGTAAATIAMMYSSGVFFLPPGINPAKW